MTTSRDSSRSRLMAQTWTRRSKARCNFLNKKDEQARKESEAQHINRRVISRVEACTTGYLTLRTQLRRKARRTARLTSTVLRKPINKHWELIQEVPIIPSLMEVLMVSEPGLMPISVELPVIQTSSKRRQVDPQDCSWNQRKYRAFQTQISTVSNHITQLRHATSANTISMDSLECTNFTLPRECCTTSYEKNQTR